MADHIHFLFGANPDDKISDLVACIKRESSTFINSKNWFRNKFHWQDGYGAFLMQDLNWIRFTNI